MTIKKILIFSGSTRQGSMNTKLASAAYRAALAAGADATLIDLKDYPADIYNGDDEANQGMPDTMRALKQLMAASDGIIVVTPEYNGHVPPLLVNTFSWLSRSEEGDNGLSAFRGKKAAIMAASPGRLGGIRVLPRLRDMLAELGVMVVPGFVTLPQAGAAFDEHGTLHERKVQDSVSAKVEKLMQA
ncbi:MAG: NAD(P)H-dependent oxidoreductase [Pseudomonadota bacterium]